MFGRIAQPETPTTTRDSTGNSISPLVASTNRISHFALRDEASIISHGYEFQGDSTQSYSIRSVFSKWIVRLNTQNNDVFRRGQVSGLNGFVAGWELQNHFDSRAFLNSVCQLTITSNLCDPWSTAVLTRNRLPPGATA